MSREIKFRGKRLDNGEWVHGQYVSGLHVDGLQNYTRAHIMHFGRLHGALKRVEVDPATVGQYTGLKDKNGVEIYEGDVIASRNGTTSQRNGIVEFDSISAKFTLTAAKAAEPVNSLATAASRGTVIGNIYENPELLK